jgi:hypothetical protein
MGGREFATIAGDPPYAPVTSADIAALIGRGTMALPSFVDQDGVFPGSALQGRVVGPPPETPAARHALALLYVALLTDICLEWLGAAEATTMLDGSFARNPLYPALVAALRPEGRVLFNTDAYGTASGAALLAGHAARSGPVPVAVDPAPAIALPGLRDYAAAWRRRAEARPPTQPPAPKATP